MKTIEDYLKEEYFDTSNENQFLKAKIAAKKYTHECIKTDRLNLVEHATAYIQNTREGYNDEAVIDKDSIINAPNIELL